MRIGSTGGKTMAGLDWIGDIVGAIGGSQAADQQAQSAQQAMDLQRFIYEQSRRDRMPYLRQGDQSMAQLGALTRKGSFDTPLRTLNPSDLANDPGYQFRMAEGQKALERSAAARGGLNSGGFMKGLDRYSQGFASNEYQNAFQRTMQQNQQSMDANQNRYGRLYNLATMGANAAAGMGTQGQSYANSMSALYGAQGNANAAGTMALYNGIGGTANAFGSNLAAGMGMMGGMPGGGIPMQGGYGSGGYYGGGR